MTEETMDRRRRVMVIGYSFQARQDKIRELVEVYGQPLTSVIDIGTYNQVRGIHGMNYVDVGLPPEPNERMANEYYKIKEELRINRCREVKPGRAM